MELVIKTLKCKIVMFSMSLFGRLCWVWPLDLKLILPMVSGIFYWLRSTVEWSPSSLMGQAVGRGDDALDFSLPGLKVALCLIVPVSVFYHQIQLLFTLANESFSSTPPVLWLWNEMDPQPGSWRLYVKHVGPSNIAFSIRWEILDMYINMSELWMFFNTAL